jgi:hypothetical protein
MNKTFLYSKTLEYRFLVADSPSQALPTTHSGIRVSASKSGAFAALKVTFQSAPDGCLF